VWVGAHAGASATGNDVQDSTGGVIVNERAGDRRELPGGATPRARLAITGPAHAVTPRDRRVVEVQIH